MADNVNIRDFGNNSVPVASDEVSGAQFQVVKIAYGTQDSVTYASPASPLPVSAVGASIIAGLQSDFTPGYSENSNIPTTIKADPDGNIKTRGNILTDEGSYRINFSNSSLAVAIPSCTFTNGSNIVTCVSGLTNLIYDMHKGVYVYLNADGVSQALQVIDYNDSTMILESAYLGTGGTGASSRQIINSKIGSGNSLTVINGFAIGTIGTTSGSVFELERDVDVLPLVKQTELSISNRILNQSIQIGFYDDSDTVFGIARYWAYFVLDGIDATKIRCESARNPNTIPTGNEVQSTTITIPNSKTTNQSIRYRVELLFDHVNFWLDGILVAQHYQEVPLPDDILTSTIRCVNTNTTSVTNTLSINYDTCKNFDIVDVYNGQDIVTNSTPQPVGGDILLELVQTLEQLAMTLQSMGGLGEAKDPTTARLRVTLDNIAGSLTLGTVTTVGTVSTITGGTITTLAGQTNIGGYAAVDQIPSLVNMVAQNMIMNGVVVS